MHITYFAHGTTIDNEKNIASGWLPGKLSTLGIKQSKKLGELVADKKFEVVFYSDLRRAVEAVGLAFGNKNKIIRDKRLREINYGDWQPGWEYIY